MKGRVATAFRPRRSAQSASPTNSSSSGIGGSAVLPAVGTSVVSRSVSGPAVGGHEHVVVPRDLKSVVGKLAPHLSGFAQQDCQELLRFLLDGLSEDLNRTGKKLKLKRESAKLQQKQQQQQQDDNDDDDERSGVSDKKAKKEEAEVKPVDERAESERMWRANRERNSSIVVTSSRASCAAASSARPASTSPCLRPLPRHLRPIPDSACG